ncbi:MAG: ABC transporter permease [Bacilli bacterium]|nr:ABC transporter permease [Bacilli bacterium]
MKRGLFSRIFGRLLRREIFKDWAQSLAIVSIGAIAVTLFVGLSANSGAMESSLDEMIRLSHPADIYVTTDPRSLKAEDDSDMILSKLDEGDYIESRFLGYCNMESHNIALACTYSLPTVSTGYEIRLHESSTDTDFFYVDQSYYEDRLMKDPKDQLLGEEVEISFDVSSFGINESTLSLLDSFLLEGKTNPFRSGSLSMHSTVTGIMKHPENTTKANPIPMVTYMSNTRFKRIVIASLKESFTTLGTKLIYSEGFHKILGWGDGNIDGSARRFPAPNQYLVCLKDPSTAAAKRDAIAKAYEQKKENNLYSAQALEDTVFISTLRMEIDQAEKLSLVFPVVFFIVAVLVIITTLRQNILKRRTEIGTYKALGLTRLEIHAHFQMQTGLLVSIASLIGAVIGPLLLPGIMAHKYEILYTMPAEKYYFPVAQGLISIGAFLLVSLLFTYLITRREIALKPVESMRPKVLKMHRQLIKSQGHKSAIALSAKMAGRNIIYDPVKSLMVILGLVGCTALLVCGFGIENTIDYDIATDPYVNSYRDDMATFLPARNAEDIELDFSQVTSETGEKMISTYQPFDRFSEEVLNGEHSYTTYIFVLGPTVSYDGSEVPFHMDSDFPKDQVLLSTKASRILGVSAGDTVKFYASSTYVEAKVARIYDAFYGNSIIMHYDCPLLSTPYSEYQFAWIESAKGVSQAELKDRLLEDVESVRLVDTAEEWKARVESIVSSISTMTTAIKIFAVLLAIVVIYDLGLLNYRERTREIATMKVLGFHTIEIAVSLLIEALSMTLIGIVGGLAAGFPFMKLVLDINQIDIIQYIYRIEPLTYVLSALGSFFVAVLVNIVLSYRIKKVHAVESLKSVE